MSDEPWGFIAPFFKHSTIGKDKLGNKNQMKKNVMSMVGQR